MPPKRKGVTPKRGGIPRRPLVSPWWDSVLASLSQREDLRGKVIGCDELVALIVELPGTGAKRIHAMGAVRRLAPMLELVERGPNGSRSRGARYRIVEPPAVPEDGMADEGWLLAAADRMAGGAGKRKRKRERKR